VNQYADLQALADPQHFRRRPRCVLVNVAYRARTLFERQAFVLSLVDDETEPPEMLDRRATSSWLTGAQSEQIHLLCRSHNKVTLVLARIDDGELRDLSRTALSLDGWMGDYTLSFSL